jgi:hypothetical protein
MAKPPSSSSGTRSPGTRSPETRSPGTGSPGSKSPADKSAQSLSTAALSPTALPPTAVAKRAKTGTSGNGNRAADQGQLELVPAEPEEQEEADGSTVSEGAPTVVPNYAAATQTAASSPITPPPSSADQAAGAPTFAAPPAMRELGLTAKEMWKVDLKGKRIALDEKAWREELARALGRAPTKG